MEDFSFVLTICFVLLGPLKIIAPFAEIARGEERREQRRLAVFAALVATAICLFVVGVGTKLVETYQLRFEAVQLGGGLVLLLSALGVIFPRTEPKADQEERLPTLRRAIAPLATPIIVTPAGIAALLVFVMSAPAYPGMYQALGIALLVILSLDFVVMFFNASLIRVPGLLPGLQVIGSVLVFIQVALAIEVMLRAMRSLGVIAR